MSRWPILAVAVAAGSALACDSVLPPTGYIALYVDTDAPLPRPSAAASAEGSPAPLFDRVRIEIYPPGATRPCVGCSRDFDLTEDLVRSGASVSIVPSADPSPRVHVVMYRGAAVVDDSFPTGSPVEVWALLPSAPREGPNEVTVFLPTDRAGRPLGTPESPTPTTLGPPQPSRVGTWAGARRVPCEGQPSPGEVCVPGGAYWMGNTLQDVAGPLSADRQRLVVVSPFFIDDREMTVGAFRSLHLAIPSGGLKLFSGGTTGSANDDWCRYTETPGPNEDMPLNCVRLDVAMAACAARGATLPTEAQFEYVASGLSGSLYTWGSDPPACSDAVWGRGGAGRLAGYPSQCRPTQESDLGGPLPVPSDSSTTRLVALSRQRAGFALGGRVIWDLAGNLDEYTLDAFQRQDEPCWSVPGSNVFVDPRCDVAGKDSAGADGPYQAVRGGAWTNAFIEIRASARAAVPKSLATIAVGFRCVRNATPR